MSRAMHLLDTLDSLGIQLTTSGCRIIARIPAPGIIDPDI